jgi:hypothetical protein
MFTSLVGYKTYLLGAGVIISAICSYLAGVADLGQTLNIIWPALMGMFIRNGVTTTVNKAVQSVEAANEAARK